MMKKQFLECFSAPTRATALRELVQRLVEQQGVSAATLCIWCLASGHSRKTVSCRLSRVFCALGLRTRIKGAGRKPSPEAAKVREYLRAEYGERFLKVLYATVREAKAQAAENSKIEPCAAYVTTSHSGPALPILENDCASAISNGLKTAKLDNAHPVSTGRTSFEKASTATINAGNQTRSVPL